MYIDDLDLLLQCAETVKQKHTCQNDTLQTMLQVESKTTPHLVSIKIHDDFPQRNTCCLYYRKCKHWDIFHLLG